MIENIINFDELSYIVKDALKDLIINAIVDEGVVDSETIDLDTTPVENILKDVDKQVSKILDNFNLSSNTLSSIDQSLKDLFNLSSTSVDKINSNLVDIYNDSENVVKALDKINHHLLLPGKEIIKESLILAKGIGNFSKSFNFNKNIGLISTNVSQSSFTLGDYFTISINNINIINKNYLISNNTNYKMFRIIPIPLNSILTFSFTNIKDTKNVYIGLDYIEFDGNIINEGDD